MHPPFSNFKTISTENILGTIYSTKWLISNFTGTTIILEISVSNWHRYAYYSITKVVRMSPHMWGGRYDERRRETAPVTKVIKFSVARRHMTRWLLKLTRNKLFKWKLLFVTWRRRFWTVSPHVFLIRPTYDTSLNISWPK